MNRLYIMTKADNNCNPEKEGVDRGSRAELKDPSMVKITLVVYQELKIIHPLAQQP